MFIFFQSKQTFSGALHVFIDLQNRDENKTQQCNGFIEQHMLHNMLHNIYCKSFIADRLP